MIGILGGTFDPVHFGHLRTGLEVAEALGLDQLRFVPSHRPPHRRDPQASPWQRLAMLELAVRSEPRFAVDDREVRCPGPSYSVHTLATTRAELGEESLCFLVGMDAFLELDTWRDWQALFEHCHFIVMHRPGVRGDYAARFRNLIGPRLVHHRSALRCASHGHVLVLPVTQLDISATAIRQMIRGRRSPRFLLPDAVLELIERWELYR